jgi:hypothetical protein
VVAELLMHALQADYVVLGGGQTKKLKSVPKFARLGDNANAIVGGVRLWAGGKGAPVSARSAKTAPRRKA